MSGGFGIEVDGLKELQKSLRDLGGREMTRQLRDGSLAAATVVTDEANTKLARSGRLGRALVRQNAIRAGGGQRDAFVKIGGKRPKVRQAAAAMEFGAKRARYQFSGPWVGNQHTQHLGTAGEGRFVAWAAHRKAAEAVRAWERVLQQIIDRSLS